MALRLGRGVPHVDGAWVKSEPRGLEYGRRLVGLTPLDARSAGPPVVLLWFSSSSSSSSLFLFVFDVGVSRTRRG